MTPSRWHQSNSLIYYAQCSIGLYYASGLLTKNEKLRTHTHTHIWKNTCICMGKFSALMLHCAWCILKLQMWMWFDDSYQMHK